MHARLTRTLIAYLAALGLLLGALVPAEVVTAQDAATPVATPQATPVAEPETPSGTVDLDVLFVGAHPDDEAFNLAAYGQWNEYAGVSVGVITVTRGEGGGNAVGTEEGPALGLIREAEEREAVSVAGIEHIYNLDKVDFYYTVSAPLTIQTWDYEDTLERVVRVVRATRPEVIITMNPAPTPGNHGHHQTAARLAVDAFYAAADPIRFPEQVETEGLDTWSAATLYQAGGSVTAQPGPDCATTFTANEPTNTIFGVWQGTTSERHDGRTWAAVARDGQRTYASQGWAVFADVSEDPNELACNFFTLIDTRVPISTDPASTTAALENSVIAVDGGLPLGTEFYLTTSGFEVLPGQEFIVTAHVSDPAGEVTLTAPDGWEATARGDLSESPAGDGHFTQEFAIVPAADATAGSRYAIQATYELDGASGSTTEAVVVSPAVSGVLAPRAEIAQFYDWASASGVPQLTGLIGALDSIAVGASRSLDVVVTNHSAEKQSGTVSIELPAGFEAESASLPFEALAAGDSATVTFSVTNVDTSLPTSNEGGEGGNYPVTITTESAGGTSTSTAALNLVPATTVPQASTGLAVDGVIAEGEYTGEALDLSRIWEGQELDSPEDASGSAWLAWDENGIYVAVEVQDDVLGTVLTPDDAKRHWRTDSVEIAIDPLGTAPNTSATFKVGVFPTSTDGEPQAYRDADAYQGPVSETAPGFEVASTISEPYTGYVMEVFIPFEALPANLDPMNAAMNIFIYDSDTDDLTGQTRLGWSTWGGVQGDPYRWGKTTFEGLNVPMVESDVDAPIMPLDVAQSTRSPMSIAQSAQDGVGLAGRAQVSEGEGITFTEPVTLAGGDLSFTFEAGSEPGLVVGFLVDDAGTVIHEFEQEVEANSVNAAVTGPVEGDGARLLVSFETESGKVQALALEVESTD